MGVIAKLGNFSADDMKKLQKQLNEIKEYQINAFIDGCAKELAARLLAKVIKLTPVGQYSKSSGKKGGTLHRGWTSKTHEEAASGGRSSASAYVDSLKIHHYGNMIVIEIINPVEYASYVEYGHRTTNHKGWIQGQFMLTISEQQIQSIAPKVLESKIKSFFKEHLK